MSQMYNMRQGRLSRGWIHIPCHLERVRTIKEKNVLQW